MFWPARKHWLIDGRQPEPEDLVWLLESRALAFGEGVFTTLRLFQGEAVFLPLHLQRLRTDLTRLNAYLPEQQWQQLEAAVLQLAEQQREGVLKIRLLAGAGGSGYRRPDTDLHWHSLVQWRPLQLQTTTYEGVDLWCQPCQYRAPTQGKTLNALAQVMASEQCPAEYMEALQYDGEGWLIEGLARNLFWYRRGFWHTTPLSSGALSGILRQVLLQQLSGHLRETPVRLVDLQRAEEVLVGNSVQGIWPVRCLQDAGGTLAEWPVGAQTHQLMQQLHPLMGLPTGSGGTR